MSMPHGETTGRTQPCSTCGAGGPELAGLGTTSKPGDEPIFDLSVMAGEVRNLIDWLPNHAHRLVIVEGDSTFTGTDKPTRNIIMGHPIAATADVVLVLVRQIGLLMTRDGNDGLDYEQRLTLHKAIAYSDRNMPRHSVTWVRRAAFDKAITLRTSEGWSNVMFDGEQWDMRTNMAACIKFNDLELTWDIVRHKMVGSDSKAPEWFLRSLPGYTVIQPEPEPPMLQPLSAEAVPLGLLKMDDVALPKLDRVVAAFGKPLFKPLHAVDFAAVEQQVEAAKNKWVPKVGDGVRWTVNNHHMQAHIKAIDTADPNCVLIQLLGGRGVFQDFQRSFLCPNNMLGWVISNNGQLWINISKPEEYGRLVLDLSLMPMWGVRNLPATPADMRQAELAEEGTGVPAQVRLDNEEESEVWSAFAQYCANEEGITLDDKEGERVLAFFVRMRRRLCEMLD